MYKRQVRDVSFKAHAGEIVGIAGLMGAGRTETTRAIFGADPKESGEILVDGKTIKIHGPHDAIRAGVVLAPEDRKKDGLCTKLYIGTKFVLYRETHAKPKEKRIALVKDKKKKTV